MSERAPAVLATRHRIRPGFRSWLAHHRSVAVQTLVKLTEQRLSNFLSCLVIGIAMALPTLFYLMLMNLAQISENWDGQPRLSLYLAKDADPARVAAEVTSKLDVARVTLIPAEDALATFAASSGFSDVLAALDDNPLPTVLEVRPEGTAEELSQIIADMRGLDGVDDVTADIAWIERLHALVRFGEYLVMVVGVLLAFGVTLSIGNTIRLAIENRRAEILVVKLVGGTDAFVRRPFLYLGLWYGLGGAILSCLMLSGSALLLQGPVQTLVASYESSYSLRGLKFLDAVILLVVGMVLGVMGAALAVGRHLREIEPQ